jgi:hypothetical protein
MSGFLRPAAAKMSTTSSETTALEMIWRMARSSTSRRALLRMCGCQSSGSDADPLQASSIHSNRIVKYCLPLE